MAMEMEAEGGGNEHCFDVITHHMHLTVKSHSESIHSCILPCMVQPGIAELQWEMQPNWFTANVHMNCSHSRRHKNGPYKSL